MAVLGGIGAKRMPSLPAPLADLDDSSQLSDAVLFLHRLDSVQCREMHARFGSRPSQRCLNRERGRVLCRPAWTLAIRKVRPAWEEKSRSGHRGGAGY